MSEEKDDINYVVLKEDQLLSLDRRAIIKYWHQQDRYISFIQDKHIEDVKQLECRLNHALQEASKKDELMLYRLSIKEQEIQEYVNQIAEMKSSSASSSVRTLLLDPAVNMVIEKLKQELSSTKAKMEETQSELSAWKFTPDSQTGKRLMAKCRLLHQENEDLGKVIASGKLAKLEAELALQRNLAEEMKKSQSEMDEFVQELDDDVEGMQSTILFLQQQLKETKTQLAAASLKAASVQNSPPPSSGVQLTPPGSTAFAVDTAQSSAVQVHYEFPPVVKGERNPMVAVAFSTEVKPVDKKVETVEPAMDVEPPSQPVDDEEPPAAGQPGVPALWTGRAVMGPPVCLAAQHIDSAASTGTGAGGQQSDKETAVSSGSVASATSVLVPDAPSVRMDCSEPVPRVDSPPSHPPLSLMVNTSLENQSCSVSHKPLTEAAACVRVAAAPTVTVDSIDEVPVSPTVTAGSLDEVPVSPTVTSVSIDEAPVSPTVTAGSIDETPVSLTVTAVSIDEAPVSPTATAGSIDLAPVSPTVAAGSVDEAPVSPTVAAGSIDEAPVSPTATACSIDEAPVSPTATACSIDEAPVSPTVAADSIDEAPVSPTVAADSIDEAPVPPTVAADSIDEAPVSPTVVKSPASDMMCEERINHPISHVDRNLSPEAPQLPSALLESGTLLTEPPSQDESQSETAVSALSAGNGSDRTMTEKFGETMSNDKVGRLQQNRELSEMIRPLKKRSRPNPASESSPPLLNSRPSIPESPPPVPESSPPVPESPPPVPESPPPVPESPSPVPESSPPVPNSPPPESEQCDLELNNRTLLSAEQDQKLPVSAESSKAEADATVNVDALCGGGKQQQISDARNSDSDNVVDVSDTRNPDAVDASDARNSDADNLADFSDARNSDAGNVADSSDARNSDAGNVADPSDARNSDAGNVADPSDARDSVADVMDASVQEARKTGSSGVQMVVPADDFVGLDTDLSNHGMPSRNGEVCVALNGTPTVDDATGDSTTDADDSTASVQDSHARHVTAVDASSGGVPGARFRESSPDSPDEIRVRRAALPGEKRVSRRLNTYSRCRLRPCESEAPTACGDDLETPSEEDATPRVQPGVVTHGRRSVVPYDDDSPTSDSDGDKLKIAELPVVFRSCGRADTASSGEHATSPYSSSVQPSEPVRPSQRRTKGREVRAKRRSTADRSSSRSTVTKDKHRSSSVKAGAETPTRLADGDVGVERRTKRRSSSQQQHGQTAVHAEIRTKRRTSEGGSPSLKRTRLAATDELTSPVPE